MNTQRYMTRRVGHSARRWASLGAIVGSVVGGLIAADAKAQPQYIFFASQSRVVTASSLDGPTVTISAPNYFPFGYTAFSRNPFDACWASASQDSTLEGSRITMTGATRGFRSNSFVPYPSATTSLDATFNIYGPCFFRLASTWSLARWSLSGPGVSVVSIGSVGQTTRSGTLHVGVYTLHIESSLDHGGGTIFPTDVSLDFQVSRCIADVDDGSGTGSPDGGVTIDDLLFYMSVFEAGDLRADVDDGSGTATHDGGVTIDDLLFYLARFEAGC